MVAAIVILTIRFATDIFSGSAQVEPRQTEEIATALVITPPAQDESAASILPTIKLEWVEIGTARNGTEVLALPIPWDRIGTYQLPPLWDQVANLPPAADLSRSGGPMREMIGAYLKGNMVIVYMYTDNHPNDAWILTYWKAEVSPSEIEGLRP
tara:strand:+ start:483 stop:944 length:462 start_codon:yes stop_codon:yes gene_type:complete